MSTIFTIHSPLQPRTTMPKYSDILPIDKHKDEILDTISRNQVVVIAGDTGSGKTTRIPQFCLELVTEDTRYIGCTQPRRLAAVSVSQRVGEEIEAPEQVSYKIRFHDYTTAETKIKFMTDGVLLAETKNDPNLQRYSILILDEAHERNLNIDFLLGYLKRLLSKRDDLKLIITSATIDTNAFSRHFDNAPIISIEGRTYPVEVRYAPMDEEDEDYLEHCTKVVEKLFLTERPGDTLIFLPTEKNIRTCSEMLSKLLPHTEVMPLFGRLQANDQRRIFQPCAKTKIVVATNVAETSITVPGIRYVIDSGLARMTYYNVRSKTTSLPIQKISKASCDQRKGRCGRIGPGICIRLFAKEDYENRDQFTLPEIKRSNLAEVLLQMSRLRLGDPDKFPFIDPPASNVIRDGYSLLKELGAIGPAYQLTRRGKIMADLPIDPCISRVLLEANDNNCLREIKIIASALAIQDPRIRPAEKEKEADAIHKDFAHKHSDFLGLINIWNSFHTLPGEFSWSKLKRFCKINFLSFQRMREWIDLHEQLCRILNRYQEFCDNEVEASYEQIHRALLSGFLRNIATKQQKKIYLGAGNKELMIFPGSHQFQNSGQWIMASGFLETGRLYALTVATIEPEWIEPLAGNLCKYSWSQPRWEKKSGQVVADEKVTLFGLVLVASRKTNFAERHPKNIKESRDIFIQYALLPGEISGKLPFLKHNIELVDKWRKAEERLRKRDILQNDDSLYQFYAERLPEDVYDRATLNTFLHKKNQQHFLEMTEADILLRTPEKSEFSDFPTTLRIGSFDFSISYQFNPSGKRDGLSVHIPFGLASAISPQSFEWLVPGFLHEKITLLLKGLPKSLRKKLVPVNSTVDRLMDDIKLGQGSLLAALESSILKLFRFTPQRSDWPQELPSHLSPHFILEDDKGKEIVSGADLKKILLGTPSLPKSGETACTAKEGEQKIIDLWQNKECELWVFDNLPVKLPLYSKQGSIAGFLFTTLVPVPSKGVVKVDFIRDQKESEALNCAGLLFLHQLQFKGQIKSLRIACSNALSAPSALWLVRNYKDKKDAADSMLQFVLKNIFDTKNATFPTKESFNATTERVKQDGFYKIGNGLCIDINNILRERNITSERINSVFLSRQKGPTDSAEKEKFISLATKILPSSFLETFNMFDVKNCIRQLKSLQIRLERFDANPQKDVQKEKMLLPHVHNFEKACKNLDDLTEEANKLLTQYNVLIQEYSISLFSPEIKTILPVSEKKLLEHWTLTQSQM